MNILNHPTEKVMFRKWNQKPYSVIVIWPGVPANNSGSLCQSYEHIGQHGGCYFDGIIRITSPAKPEEYAELLHELIAIGYKPVVIKRANRKLIEHRILTLKP